MMIFLGFDIVNPFSVKNSVLATILIGCLYGCSSTQISPPPQAESTAQFGTTEQAKPVDGDDQAKPEKKIVCKNRKPLGSRIPKRECMSKQSWDRIAEASQGARDKVNKPAYNRVNSPN